MVDEGAVVVAGARSETAAITELVEGGRVVFVPVDFSDPAGPARLVDAAVDSLGGLDVLVNNVGAVTVRNEGSSRSPTKSGSRPSTSASSRH
ncbi:SDR family NAD(P)-dependent oxidoreductase [Herbiconiux sp. L3-i23]|uniref:SDR family NAD(P)-dependent oxidoreductase n=1 Tax=Herbiconiux sp. L3-i23 TaxID=2905871 RepID=UPI003530CBA4